eukprot:TRINITY_DN4935_c0_g1_i4.p1 TRINITY_DN4935_c0_g1~~TRINITY_DN4935_c0_g1_i4.p1  ORF type:complete len:264 (-),score=13.24 TRINITY_DN4935_c0_g1_i4:285-1076(-)
MLLSLRKETMPFFFFQAEDGIRDHAQSRGLGDVYKRQVRQRGWGDTVLTPTFTKFAMIQGYQLVFHAVHVIYIGALNSLDNELQNYQTYSFNLCFLLQLITFIASRSFGDLEITSIIQDLRRNRRLQIVLLISIIVEVFIVEFTQSAIPVVLWLFAIFAPLGNLILCERFRGMWNQTIRARDYAYSTEFHMLGIFVVHLKSIGEQQLWYGRIVGSLTSLSLRQLSIEYINRNQITYSTQMSEVKAKEIPYTSLYALNRIRMSS